MKQPWHSFAPTANLVSFAKLCVASALTARRCGAGRMPIALYGRPARLSTPSVTMMQGGTKEESLAMFRMNPVPLWVRVDALMNSYMRTMKETDQTIQALSKLKVTNVQIAGCA